MRAILLFLARHYLIKRLPLSWKTDRVIRAIFIKTPESGYVILFRKRKENPMKEKSMAEKITAYIEEHLNEDLSLDRNAEELNYSTWPELLRRKRKAQFINI